mmetsp:Transcript_38654/g.93452  ORF Transcript_38654/g.93452 Transcript_38654/m.93452 type:complete len:86 (-) Transcript_38654:286-543(-)
MTTRQLTDPITATRTRKSQVISFLWQLLHNKTPPGTFDKTIIVMTSSKIIGNPTIHKDLQEYGRKERFASTRVGILFAIRVDRGI